jgi:D-alanyl-D-alanine carboxypeptidase
VGGLAVIALAGAAFGAYGFYEAHGARQALASTTSAYASIQASLAEASSSNADLAQSLRDQQVQYGYCVDLVNQLNGKVGSLTKLSQTDPQLLAKYSKTYFLNENYAPASLTNIASQYLYDKSRTLQFETDAYPFLQRLLADAQAQGISLFAGSAYRSFDTQSTLKAQYKVVYGTGANAFSADQGYSEHQLGTAVDFTTSGLKGGLDGFDQDPAYAWLKDNAYKYGFVLSYPPDNAYYEFEPWHWRFVGKALALYLYDRGQNFYDLDQRTIDGYLGSIFSQN